jgi:hypothetical protein
MSSTKLGWVKSGQSKRSIEVKWNPYSKEVYVSWGGWTYVGKAYSASEAMTKAEAWLYNK